jgi:hypothetical protein
VKNVEHQSKTFYEGTQKLVDRWTEWVEKDGRDYRVLYPWR